MYRDNPFSLPELRSQCVVCHTQPEGGGPRNEFGKAFVKEDRLMTETLRTNYPMMFMQDNRALVDDMEVIFSDSENKSILLRKGDSVYRVDLPSKQVKKLEAPDLVAMKLPEAIPQKIIDRSRAKMPEPVYNLPFDGYLVNLPTTRQLPKGAVSVRFTHRFSSSTFNQRRRYGTPFDLFGLDSTATVGYGVSYGLTRRISIGVYRSRFDYLSRAIGGKGENPIEFNGDFHIFQESEGRFPISLVARAALEGDNFFKDFFRPDLQLIVGRSVGSFATVYLVPTVSFNTNPRPRGRELPGEKHSTVALGIGASLRPLKRLPRLALVGEYVPRLWGFNIWNNNYKPTASAGIQFRTYRHAFSFVVTNTRGTTTSAYGQGDTSSFSSHPIDAFSLGFNITRQLH
ncbi:MAG: hypothetical protein HY232_05050 [Acidobacteria bacterium]|nr:hypothetical protein [Acidobacteriota bacterium]